MQTVSIVLSVYNQVNLILPVLQALYNHKSENVKEFILVLDGCNDGTEKLALEFLKGSLIKYIVKYADNVFETKANNIGFKAATCDYIFTIQDDAVIYEHNFDKRMMQPFSLRNDILGVTGRNAQDQYIKDGVLEYKNLAGRDVNSPRDIFCIRDAIVRTPVMFDHKKLESLGYLDESFAPLWGDDIDLSLRAYRKNYVVGSYATDYYSPPEWGKTRNNPTSNTIFYWSSEKNKRLIIDRHKDLLDAEKHGEDIIISQEVF